MRININLASQPYEVAREYKRRMTMLIAGLAVVAVVLVGYILYQRAHSRIINRQLAELQRQMDALNHEESQARATLNRPANKEIADQSEFLNELFARKSMSWTHIFTVMEKIVPPELHVTSMKPEYSKSGDLVLHVVVATDSRDRAVEMVRNMEKSTHFHQPQVVAENVVANTSDQGQAGGIQFDIAAIYVPGTMEADESPAADKTTGAATASPKTPAATPGASASHNPAAPSAPNARAGSVQPNVNAAQNQPVPPTTAMRRH
ncbi:MAG: PilN domain-containing protein [Candidatus Korobacteraceae bacterium]